MCERDVTGCEAGLGVRKVCGEVGGPGCERRVSGCGGWAGVSEVVGCVRGV